MSSLLPPSREDASARSSDVRRDDDASPPRTRSPRIDALAAAPDIATVAEFWGEVEASGTPLLEEVCAEECTYTFVYRGDARTECVVLLGQEGVDARSEYWARCSRVAGTDIWWCSLRHRCAWRSAYAFGIFHVVPRANGHAGATQYRVSADPFAQESAPPGARLPSMVAVPHAEA